ncbi:hypothetical protein DOMOVOI_05500 [Brevundimonas phage vB_BpoS-Domovoi]|uniref:Uncharacterized protein n=1 Tax=Brevundimonas phage vB_BpoS-Domovoi TaxID=2948598 RepID=A0A9E7MR43_9CAUD|nr:hypothetical protein DOMOVOI_05500 [Brevundimonas phage vB_BpoS-Domovoi]
MTLPHLILFVLLAATIVEIVSVLWLPSEGRR